MLLNLESVENHKRAAFQIRSSWTQFLMPERFLRVENSTTYVFSIDLHSPIPPAGTSIFNELLFFYKSIALMTYSRSTTSLSLISFSMGCCRKTGSRTAEIRPSPVESPPWIHLSAHSGAASLSRLRMCAQEVPL